MSDKRYYVKLKFRYFRNKELATTKVEENAIAAPAQIGCK